MVGMPCVTLPRHKGGRALVPRKVFAEPVGATLAVAPVHIVHIVNIVHKVAHGVPPCFPTHGEGAMLYLLLFLSAIKYLFVADMVVNPERLKHLPHIFGQDAVLDIQVKIHCDAFP